MHKSLEFHKIGLLEQVFFFFGMLAVSDDALRIVCSHLNSRDAGSLRLASFQFQRILSDRRDLYLCAYRPLIEYTLLAFYIPLAWSGSLPFLLLALASSSIFAICIGHTIIWTTFFVLPLNYVLVLHTFCHLSSSTVAERSCQLQEFYFKSVGLSFYFLLALVMLIWAIRIVGRILRLIRLTRTRRIVLFLGMH